MARLLFSLIKKSIKQLIFIEKKTDQCKVKTISFSGLFALFIIACAPMAGAQNYNEWYYSGNSSSDESLTSKVRRNCLADITWNQVECRFQDNPKYNSLGIESHFAKMNLQFFEIFIKSYQVVREKIPFRTEGIDKRQAIFELLSPQFERGQLSTCQSACLLKCVSSNILEYNANIATKFGTVNYLYSAEEGVCTEFSEIFDDLAARFNVNSRVVASIAQAHAFNKVKIRGKWVYLEPQSDRCEFFTEEPENFEMGGVRSPANIINSLRQSGEESLPISRDNTRISHPRVNEN